jgi:hypothetical protein
LISKIRVENEVYDGPAEIHAFVASDLRGAPRKYAVFKTEHFSHASQIFSDTFPFPSVPKWAALVLEAYIETTTDDNFVALTKQGHAIVDLSLPIPTSIRFNSVLLIDSEGKTDHDYAGVSLQLRVEWKKMTKPLLMTCPYPVRLDPELVRRRFAELRSDYSGPLSGKKTILGDAFRCVANPIYVFNSQTILGAMFWASIEESLYSSQFVEHCAHLALSIIDPTLTFETYLSSKLHSECPTYFFQLVAQLYAVCCPYVDDIRYDFGAGRPGSWHAEAKQVDSFDQLSITNGGDCEDKDTAIWSMLEAMGAYKGDPNLKSLLAPMKKYTPFLSLVSNRASDGHMAHFNAMLIHADVQESPSMLSFAEYTRRDTMPPLIIIDSIRPSWTLPDGFFKRHPNFKATVEEALSWQPSNPGGRFTSCAAMTPKIHELDSDYPSQLVILRLECAPQTFCGRPNVYAFVPMTGDKIGVLASDMAVTNTPITLYSTDQLKNWERDLGALAFRHPPVGPKTIAIPRTPRGGISGLSVNLFVDTDQERDFDDALKRLQDRVKKWISKSEVIRLQVEGRGVRESVVRLVIQE